MSCFSVVKVKEPCQGTKATAAAQDTAQASLSCIHPHLHLHPSRVRSHCKACATPSSYASFLPALDPHPTPPLSADAGNLAIQLDGAGRPHLLVGGLHPCPPGDRPGGPPGQGAPGEPNPISLLSFPYPSGRCPGCAAALSVSEKGCWLWCVSDKTPAVMFLVCFDGGLQHHAWLCQN